MDKKVTVLRIQLRLQQEQYLKVKCHYPLLDLEPKIEEIDPDGDY